MAEVDCGTPHLAEVYRGAPVAADDPIDSNQDRTGADPTPSTVICLLQAADGQPLTGSARH
ncbi:hypothetical protein H7I01_20260 [Mycobacterium palustre]|uniref:Uncharacterized protein n=1 Tax=Mycobacterium palustre TaxID=153971 RepID=A0A1X1ZTK7_9MYCO|nr:hypothetical protein [Mycobacterium palustre]ORW26745.1 hypothetical protein AWC19_03425 [Mycobacterium palustre]